MVAGLLLVPLAYRAVFVYELRPRGCAAAKPEAADGETIAPGAHLDVMTYNIEGHAALYDSRHLDGIAATIRAQRPDVVALQEVHRGTWQSRFTDQATLLARRTGMELAYGQSYSDMGGAFGNALLTRGRILASRVVPLPSFGEPRSLLVTTVALPGLRLDVYVTHLAAWGIVNRAIRREQLRCVRTQLRAAVRPFVLCGDLNGVVGEDLEDIARDGLVRAVGVLGEPTHPLTRRRLDYVYADPRFSIASAAVVHAGPSDHWPVVARLSWSPGGAR